MYGDQKIRLRYYHEAAACVSPCFALVTQLHSLRFGHVSYYPSDPSRSVWSVLFPSVIFGVFFPSEDPEGLCLGRGRNIQNFASFSVMGRSAYVTAHEPFWHTLLLRPRATNEEFCFFYRQWGVFIIFFGFPPQS